MQISLITKLELQYQTYTFAANCFRINEKVMFSFQVKPLQEEQALCEELSKSRGRTISFWLNNIPFSATIDTCSFSKTQDNKYYRDFNIIVTNQFFLSPN